MLLRLWLYLLRYKQWLRIWVSILSILVFYVHTYLDLSCYTWDVIICPHLLPKTHRLREPSVSIFCKNKCLSPWFRFLVKWLRFRLILKLFKKVPSLLPLTYSFPDRTLLTGFLFPLFDVTLNNLFFYYLCIGSDTMYKNDFTHHRLLYLLYPIRVIN